MPMLLAPQVTAVTPAAPPPARRPAPVTTGTSEGPLTIRTTTGQPVVNVDAQIPRQLEPILELSLSIVAVLFIGAPLAWAISRRILRRGDAQVMAPAVDLRPQLAHLQESVDAMAVELERISEAQRFAARLAAERPGTLPPASPPSPPGGTTPTAG
jgi:hypothetical protein